MPGLVEHERHHQRRKNLWQNRKHSLVDVEEGVEDLVAARMSHSAESHSATGTGQDKRSSWKPMLPYTEYPLGYQSIAVAVGELELVGTVWLDHVQCWFRRDRRLDQEHRAAELLLE